MNLAESDIRRFWNKVKIGEPDECWPWLAYVNDDGYGKFGIGSNVYSAHRVSFFIEHGYLPPKNRFDETVVIMHDCENPSCVNPKHLVPGTVKENMRYPGCIRKLREWHKTRAGKERIENVSKTLRRKFMTPDRMRIKNEILLAKKHGVLAETLAERYGKSKHLIYMIWQGRAWLS